MSTLRTLRDFRSQRSPLFLSETSFARNFRNSELRQHRSQRHLIFQSARECDTGENRSHCPVYKAARKSEPGVPVASHEKIASYSYTLASHRRRRVCVVSFCHRGEPFTFSAGKTKEDRVTAYYSRHTYIVAMATN